MSEISRYAMVRAGKVENVCSWDGEHYNAQTRKGWNPPEGVQMVKLEPAQYCEPGATYDGEKFSPPPPPEEETPGA